MHQAFSPTLPALLLMASGLALSDGPASSAHAADYFVSPHGNDHWSGLQPEPNTDQSDGPFRTVAQASASAVAGDTVYLREGVYRETLRPDHSGRPGQPIVFRNSPQETVVLTGADPLTGWRQEQEGIYSVPMDWDLEDQNQLFAGDTMLTEARWPNNTGTLLQPTRAIATDGSPTTLTDTHLPGTARDWVGATLWCAGGHKWICWAGRVTGFEPETKTLQFDAEQAAGAWYTPRAGSEYVLMGVRAALDAAGEWWYDRAGQRLHLVAPDGQPPKPAEIEAKRRLHAIDLSGRSHVHIAGLRFRAAGVFTDADSADLLLDGLHGHHVGHSYVRDLSHQSGVLIRGQRITVQNSELAYSSGSVLRLQGADHRVVNNLIHSGNYGAKWSGAVALSGRRHVVAHNAIRHSGRDLVTVHGLMESLIERNDLSNAGWLTHDLGMIYGHNTDFMNTVIRYNHVYDNRAEGLAMGIYFDHLSHNVIVHHNALWNVSGDAIRINNPSYFNLVAHNTSYRSNTAGNARAITSFDHSHRQDLFGTRWLNNLFNAPLRLPTNAIANHNLDLPDPGYTNPLQNHFVPRPNSVAIDAGIRLAGISTPSRPYLGAFPPDQAPWTCGHDFSQPPSEPAWEAARADWINAVYNACFETGTIEGWTQTGAARAAITAGNGWGNNFGSGEAAPTGTSKHELRLGGGIDGVKQKISGLQPHTRHTLSAWVRVSDPAESVRLGVQHHGGPEQSAATHETEWTRLIVEFTTGPEASDATVFLEKTSPGPGHAWCDNIGLPRARGG
jgi:hypothetical protein